MLEITITQETTTHDGVVDRLLDHTFGPGRFAQTAYRLRENNQPVAELCLLACKDGDVPIGAIQFWPVRIEDTPALLLGPLVVLPDYRGRNAGLFLMRHGLGQAKALGHERVLLVGDPSYYARVDFVPQEAKQIEFPGPVDPARVLLCSLVAGAFDGVRGRVLVPERDR
ncbi:MAG: N-acetyltransferase [Parvularculales bacterium]